MAFYFFKNQKKDVFVFLAINAIGFLIAASGIINLIVQSQRGSFVMLSLTSGFFYTTYLVSPLSIAVFSSLGLAHVNPFLVALLGGAGSLIGDSLLLQRLNIKTKKPTKLSSLKKNEVFDNVLLYRPFAWILAILAALLLVSPLPDEVGLKLMKRTQVQKRSFVLLTFFANFVGIFLIVYCVELFLSR